MLPLEGLTVVDFTELLPGPFLTQNLVDLGARVVKIERPGGDNARRLSPGLFAAVNRGKEHVVADLKDPGRRAGVAELIAAADVLVEGFRPGVMARLGFGPEKVRERHPGLIYVSISGFGQTGPLADVPGHDVTYAAYAGVLALAGELGGPPQWGPGVPVADLCASMYAMSSLLAALHARVRTGTGCYLDVSIRDCLAHWLNPRLGPFHQAGLTDREQQRAAALSRPGYGTFRCADGEPVAVAAIEDHFWSGLVKVLGLDEWADERWSTIRARGPAAERINAAIGEALACRDATEVVAELTAAGVPAAPVLAPSEAVEAARAEDAGRVVDDPDAGPLFAFPAKFLGT